MSDEATTMETNETEGQGKEETGKGLRAQLEKALEENRGFKSDRRDGFIAGIGLDVKTGLGKAIAKEYDGELTAEAVAAFAKDEYSYVKPEATHPGAGQIAAEQARVDVVGQSTQPVPSGNIHTEIAKANAEGDFDKAGLLNAQLMQQQMGQANPFG